MSRMRTNAQVAAVLMTMLAGFEGLRTVAYRDPVGIPTICFGSTRGVKIGDVKTEAECRKLLRRDALEHERGMLRCLRDPDALDDGAYVAFNSFAFNVGVEKFCASTLARKANAGDIEGACNELSRWIYSRGIYLPGLENRRRDERKVCLEGLPT